MSNKQSSSLKEVLQAVRRKVVIQETNDSWSTIEQGILHLTECCKNGGCESTAEMITGVRSLSRPLISAINSSRSRVSGSAIDLISALVAGLGPSFEPLISLFFPSLLGLCAQTSRLFTCRAKACVFAVIRGTQSPSLLPYLAEYLHHKSASLRLVAAEGILTYMDCVNPIHIDHHAHIIEDITRLTARDASADVRKAGAEISVAYKALLPDRVERFPASTVQFTSHQTTGRARQGVLPPRPKPAPSSMPSTSQRRNVTLPSVPTTKRPQRGGNVLTKACDDKPHASGGGRRVQAPLPKSSGTAIGKTSVATRIHSVSSTTAVTAGPSQTVFANTEHATRGTGSRIGKSGSHGPPSTEVQLQTSSQASRRSVVASRSGQEAVGQNKPVWGGRPKGAKPVVKAVSSKATAQADTLHIVDVRCPCTNAMASMCKVETPGSYSKTPQAFRTPLSSIQGKLLRTPSHVPQVVLRPSNRLPRAPRQQRRESICESPGDCSDVTLSFCDRPIRPFVSCLQRASTAAPPSHVVPVPRDVTRPYIDVGPKGESLYWARGTKFAVCMDDPQGAMAPSLSTSTTSDDVHISQDVSGPSHTDNLEGVQVSQFQFSLDAPISASSALPPQPHRKTRPSSRSRPVRKFCFEPATSPLSPVRETASISFTGNLRAILDILNIVMDDVML
ncbi:hypothetical protein AZE42_10899 [Rhizopogon vesiculosus]|uniref:CLASP N-terminal domain-containing protein n=1 Tax=Rhizopogon vesiculosus TaxID=180088 RepID=A0A1J8PMX0_9AGAM|nr:hypothetical protein AZE42_10899 [Rhizopogon vesiculosus]